MVHDILKYINVLEERYTYIFIQNWKYAENEFYCMYQN